VPAHAVMGKPTLNVGTIAGGNTVNAVADSADIGVDIRTVPGMDHAVLLRSLQDLMAEAELDVFSNLGPVWTEPDGDWVQRVFEICKPYVEDRLEARTAPYMTDAANLLKVYAGAPTVVLGPGEAAMAHQTDEYCSMERIRQSVSIYEALIDAHRDLSVEESHALNARLVLILANHVGAADVLAQALAVARAAR